MNGYYMLTDVRDNINETSASHWGDNDILRKLNAVQRRIAMLMHMTPGDWLIKSKDITPSSSLVALPSDCAKPVYMEEKSTNNPIPLTGNIRNRMTSHTLYGSFLEAYLIKGYIEVNQSNYENEVTLWYSQRVSDIHAGLAGSGSGSNTLVFDSSNEPNRSDDYYNDISVEVVSGTGDGVIADITDYDGSTYTATVSGTFAEDDNYGTVSLLPLEAHDLIVLEASLLLLTKPSSNTELAYFNFLRDRAKEAKKDFEDWVSTRSTMMVRTTEDF